MHWNWSNWWWDLTWKTEGIVKWNSLSRTYAEESTKCLEAIKKIKQQIEDLLNLSKDLEWKPEKERIDNIIKQSQESLRILEESLESQLWIMLSVLIWQYNGEIELFDSVNVWFWISNAKTRKFIRLNPALCDILEIPHWDYGWVDYPDFWGKYIINQDKFQTLKSEFKENWQVRSWLLQIRTEKWNIKWIIVFSTLIKDWEWEAITVIDVTDEVNNRKELESTKLALEAALAIIAHEWKTTLWTAVGMIKNPDTWFPWLSEEGKQNLLWIWTSLQARLKSSVEYLDLIKMIKWEFYPDYCEIDIIDSLKTEIPPDCDKWKFIFIDDDWLELDSMSSVFIQWDKVYIHSAFANLLKNATEHSSKWSKVKIKITEDKENVIITLYNDWLVEESLKPVLYKRIVKTTKVKGNWIWTYLIGMVAKSHWWSIDFTSTEEEGTITTTILPKKAAIEIPENEMLMRNLLRWGWGR